ncbi:MAG TPA: AzlC family ABC transporter permease [Marinobacterium sp.]|nr:AzlC family ABC transporter permease [Marinobacterium sp.]
MRQLLSITLPVALGYVPLGMAFGVLFVSQLDYAWYMASAMGLFIFAGSAQFLSVGLIANNAGLLEVGVAIFLLNARHIFYGISLISDLRLRGWRRWYLIFALTDESYSLITALPKEQRSQQQMWQIAMLNQSYWVIGCTLGALLGEGVDIPTESLAFVLPALFIVLCIEQYRVVRAPGLMLAAASLATLAFWLWSEQMLILSIALALSLLLMTYRSGRWIATSGG